jgi:hypothetical protein
MEKILWSDAPLQGARVSLLSSNPLSAQAHAPRRPSGAAKKQKPAKKGRSSSGAHAEAGGQCHHSLLSLNTAANHRFNPRKRMIGLKPLTIGCRSVRGLFLDENGKPPQR